MGGHFQTLLCIIGVVSGLNPVPHQKDYYVSNYILQQMMDKLSKDLSVAADNYLSLRDTPNRLKANKILADRVIKDLDNGGINDPINFEGLTDNPNPSIRDREYLQHSSLWGHKPATGGEGEGPQRWKSDESVDDNHKQVNTDATLPAYCNPPNPCPVGYTAEEGCISNFENTAAFSRDYQRSQDCMCDSEHMFDCSDIPLFPDLSDNNYDGIMEQILKKGHLMRIVARKKKLRQNANPFLHGDRLPVAAKKGINLVMAG